jgi:hypothetical protein
MKGSRLEERWMLWMRMSRQSAGKISGSMVNADFSIARSNARNELCRGEMIMIVSKCLSYSTEGRL